MYAEADDYEYNGTALKPLVTGWEGKIAHAKKLKKVQFDDDAEECMKFFDGMGNEFWEGEYASGKRGVTKKGAKVRLPVFRMTVNKVAEFQQLFGPSMYQQNPYRSVKLRKRRPLPPEILTVLAQQEIEKQLGQFPGLQLDPMQMDMLVEQQVMQVAQQEITETIFKQTAADILEEYLNYTPAELNLRSSMRRVIDEAIIKGAGVSWCELYTPPGTDMQMVGTFYDSIENLLLDPDATQWEDVRVVYRKCCQPYWEVEREYGRPPDSLKKYACKESSESKGESLANNAVAIDRNNNRTNDLLVYYKVYSKMGIGVRMSGFGKDSETGKTNSHDAIRPLLEGLDDECFLVIVPDCPYPLNLPPELQQQQFEDQPQPDGTVLPGTDQLFSAIQEAVRWPIPFWLDGGWPCELLGFHDKPGQVWPMAHLKPGLGELKFLNWAMSFLGEKVMAASNTVIGILDSMAEDATTALSETEAGYSILRIKSSLGKSLNEIITFMQSPGFQQDLYIVIDAVSQQFDKRVGLSEILYGMSQTQDRSAAESSIKQGNATIRIDDMRMRVESFSEAIARKEAIAVRWMLQNPDLEPVVGAIRAQLADSLLFNQPMDQVAREFSYTVAAGSTATRNKNMDQQNANLAIQNFMPLFGQLIGMGQVSPVNKLLEKWSDAFDVDPAGMLIAPPPPPPMMAPPGSEEGPPPAEAV